MNSDGSTLSAPPGDDESLLTQPPLSLYVHLPWCVRKCPYCDFNSHELKTDLPADEYIRALLTDLEYDLPLVWGRPVVSIFLGGGTPSLFNASQIEALLIGIRRLLTVRPDAEITMEANPGTTEYDAFSAYRDAGINRFSIGAQTFDDNALARIGRIHGSSEIFQAVESLHAAGIPNFNIDLMFGLPGQSVADAARDIELGVAAQPAHVSHYQLTLEPNTLFAANPPALPNDDLSWDMQQQAADQLEKAGFRQYEVSAWAKSGMACDHNLNYWRFGDYLGIGAGAHGKITQASTGEIKRIAKHRHPGHYLSSISTRTFVAEEHVLDSQARAFEFFLNQLRLRDGVIERDFTARTGLAWNEVASAVSAAESKGLLTWSGPESDRRLTPTPLGWRFVNETQAMFLNATVGS
jgi:oxygen-independent coproporphyrinogen-3 oxidase